MKKLQITTKDSQLMNQFRRSLYDYQLVWLDSIDNKMRNIIKSRQVGATFYFAREALIDALSTGKDQVFFTSGSGCMNSVVNYITEYAEELNAQISIFRPTSDNSELTIITLNNSANILIYGNAESPVSICANVYFDEYFYIENFKSLYKLAKVMTRKKGYRLTLYSSFSDCDYSDAKFPCYADIVWRGSHFNIGKPQKKRVYIKTTHNDLSGGRLCEDNQFRQIVNIQDAVNSGSSSLDIEALKNDVGTEYFKRLYMCEFSI